MTDFFKEMAETAHDGIMYVSADGIIRYWNTGCEKIFGFSESEALGQNLDLIIPERHRAKHWTGFDRVIETGESGYADKMLSVPAVSKDGHKLIIEFSIQVIHENGKRAGFSSIVRDITAKKVK